MCVFHLSHFTGVTIILRERCILCWGIGFDFFSIIIVYLFRIFVLTITSIYFSFIMCLTHSVTVIHCVRLVCLSFYWLFTRCSSVPKREIDDPDR
ncbi:hypothetical protein GIB67_007732 [Kingdonia uniflora]|uniref:Uncharacterized protein n=1 Tax=Kingdonia uniflora TaxID=39325 RepID=A0A7J7N1M2_9MAGN|nr:hypothetical protein GIB67_007732 [Kingdonia uniflora]